MVDKKGITKGKKLVQTASCRFVALVCLAFFILCRNKGFDVTIDTRQDNQQQAKLQIQDSAVSNQLQFTFEPLYRGNESDPWKKELFQRLDRIRSVCGTLCTNANDSKTFERNSIAVPGAHLRATIAKDINCSALLESVDIDASDGTFPQRPPEELIKYYTMGGAGQIKFGRIYKKAYLGVREIHWTEKKISDLTRRTRQAIEHPKAKGKYLRKSDSTYGVGVHMTVIGKLKKLHLQGKHVMVIGSEGPWVECACLALKAARVTTLEYGKIVSHHPQVYAMTPEEMRTQYAAGTLPLFDAIVSYSSLEHSGLGRYRDALNPWGDLLAVARAWCVSKPNAVMYIGVPMSKTNLVQFNGHRIYGKMRLSLLATNWVELEGDRPNGKKEFRGGMEPPGMLFRKLKQEELDSFLPTGST